MQSTTRQLCELRISNIDQAMLDKVSRRKFIRCQHAWASPYDLCILAQIAVLAADHDMIRCPAVMCPRNQLLRIQGIAQGEWICADVAWDDGGFGAAMDELRYGGLERRGLRSL
jgi:hypothetical protein